MNKFLFAVAFSALFLPFGMTNSDASTLNRVCNRNLPETKLPYESCRDTAMKSESKTADAKGSHDGNDDGGDDGDDGNDDNHDGHPNNGHGNDADGNDDSNPGHSNDSNDNTDDDGSPGHSGDSHGNGHGKK